MEHRRVYRFNAALHAARRYEYWLRRGVARRRGEAMRAAGNPCDHKGHPELSYSPFCEVCDQVLMPYSPAEDGEFPLLPCDWADLNEYDRRRDFHWRKGWPKLPLPEKPKIA